MIMDKYKISRIVYNRLLPHRMDIDNFSYEHGPDGTGQITILDNIRFRIWNGGPFKDYDGLKATLIDLRSELKGHQLEVMDMDVFNYIKALLIELDDAIRGMTF